MPHTISTQQITLRAEAALLAAATLWAYHQFGAGWGFFALLILAPDLCMLGYLAGPRVGAVCYNLVHSLVGPGLLAAVSLAAGQDLPLSLSLIWAAHIAIDRAIGYGLKYASGFHRTHLQRL